MEGSKIILLLYVLMGMGMNFFEIYRQFGHTPSQRIPSPGIGLQSLAGNPKRRRQLRRYRHEYKYNNIELGLKNTV